jgi:hypothetical protein
MSEVKGGSSDEEEEAKWQEHRRNWFKKANKTPTVQLWHGSPRSPSSPEQFTSPTSLNASSSSANTSSVHPVRSSGIVMGSSANLGTPNIDTVLASLFPRAKILHSSNGTVMITPNPVSVIESPPSRLEEIIGRFGVSSNHMKESSSSPFSSQKEPSTSSVYEPPQHHPSQLERRQPPPSPEELEEERRAKALRGRNLIGGILTSQQSERKVTR